MKTKYTLLIAIFTLITSEIVAQDSEGTNQGKYSASQDSVDMKASFTDDVFYTIDGNISSKVNSLRDNWDIAFSTNRFSEFIFANHGAGVEVYLYPKGDTGSWSTFDTVGLYTWKQLYGADTNINYGAFCQNYKGGQLNYSWANYNTTTHTLSGMSIYLIKIKSGYKKLWLVSKTAKNGDLKVMMADIDGKNEATTTFANESSDDYFNNYINLNTFRKVVHEPIGKNWDMWFTKYVTMIPGQNGITPYAVVGVLQNPNKCVTKLMNADLAMALKDQTECSKYSNTIGYDWKSFKNGKYSIKDSNFYIFRNSLSGQQFINFTGYNSSTGKIYFNEADYSVGLNSNSLKSQSFIFPNPNNGNKLSVVLKGNVVDYSITSLQGRTVISNSIRKENNASFNIDIEDLNLTNGFYFINFDGDFGQISHKFQIIK